MNKAWWKEAVIYQIYPKSFCDSDGDGIGDIPGILSKLDYLKNLGVSVLWISPIYESPDYDNGYDISDYQAIKRVFGSLEDFDQLLAEAHQRGLKIVMDLVVNHTSHLHEWFIESRSSKESPKRDYYIWRSGKEGGPPNNWGAWFGGSAWTLDEGTGDYYLNLFSPYQPDLNWECADMRQSVYAMMRWWLDRGVDGFRMDVISLISKDPTFPDGVIGPDGYGNAKPYVSNGPKVHDYLQEMRREVLAHYDTITVGEASGVTIEEAKKYANVDGSELSMVFQFEHMDLDGGETFKWNHDKMPLLGIKDVLTKWQVELEGKAWNSLYWCNHDQPRIVSRLGDEGALRERSAKMLATCLHLMKGTPYVYQGEELGMTNVRFDSIEDMNDLESINAFKVFTQNGRFTEQQMYDFISYKGRDNARTPMQWTSGPNAGFTAGKPWLKLNPNYLVINAEDAVSRPDSVYHYYRQLIELRKQLEVIVYGTYELIDRENDKIFTYRRHLGSQSLLVICNFTPEEIFYDHELVANHSNLMIGNCSDSTYLANRQLRPYESLVLSV